MCRIHLGRLPSLPHYFLLLQRVARFLAECHMCGRQEGGHHSLLSLFLYGLLPAECHKYTAATITIQPRSVWSASCEEPQDRRAVNCLLSLVQCGLISGECHMYRADYTSASVSSQVKFLAGHASGASLMLSATGWGGSRAASSVAGGSLSTVAMTVQCRPPPAGEGQLAGY